MAKPGRRSDYLAWVIDECDSNLEAKVIIPSVRWGGDIVRVRRFPVLRLRSLGDYAMNIAFQVCFTRQAKGADVIKLLKNAVLGQPVPPMVDPNMKPVEGAGFPQDIFEKLKFVVPVVIYLDNALAHLFNDLQEVVMRLFGGRVVLGPPGTPLGRPEVESNIHRTRKCFDLQLPGALGSGPKDPLRQSPIVRPRSSCTSTTMSRVSTVSWPTRTYRTRRQQATLTPSRG